MIEGKQVGNSLRKADHGLPFAQALKEIAEDMGHHRAVCNEWMVEEGDLCRHVIVANT